MTVIPWGGAVAVPLHAPFGLLSPVSCLGPDSVSAGDVFQKVLTQEAPDAGAQNGSGVINHGRQERVM